MKEKIKEYPVITTEEFEAKKLFMIIDVLDIFYKKHIKNSIESVNIVLNFFDKFSKENNIQCKNLYVVSFEYKGDVVGYYGCCDILSDEYLEKFSDYCDNIGLDLDYYIEDND